MFKITQGKGFQITFSNGWTVSVQFGAGNYCENYMGMIKPECPDAEIAAWDGNDKWYDFDGSGDSTSVKGRCSPDEVGAFIALIMAQPAAPKPLPEATDGVVQGILEG